MRSRIESAADDIPNYEVDGQAKIKRLIQQILERNAEHGKAVEHARNVEVLIDKLKSVEAGIQSEIVELEQRQRSLSVDALMGNAKAHQQFCDAERELIDKRLKLRQCELAGPLLPAFRTAAKRPAEGLGEQVNQLDLELASERKKAKLKLARERDS